ncbi:MULTISPECIES: patatin-like phospholipase family protein [unclassified Roseofilum]|uniref:patatin-like phospholipase family protein n=1 Tax=unclassified Roseofilum TaxID=2620099 RepID=UPI000E7DD22E|nr:MULTISPECIES: patatin-like phospholipase family protein [unclassified Roseofilum]HBQ99592.1 phospholipase [Cyanobacteria bacterium UBA11691]MBP0007164.1 patatin-like phospholipase family protein [Roseofilum sp. Belize Diploria]MBP0013993.1 patatin-like phospholipase family protein [Roseofilum sp. SID3]MBP0025644.1 patatin-like phospholipase family protein [Roseofilum sp. SID2]MBP0032074.1 patatin-like phospholipase family protein [Roseofilum sp. Belize BBD 4]
MASFININPQLLEDQDLRLTEKQKEEIWSRFPKPVDGHYCADAIFEGGGVRGIALLGALRCCEDLGIQWKKLAGTSAGSLTAAFLAASFPINKLEEILSSIDYNGIFSQKTSPFIFNGDPSDDLQAPLWMIVSLLLTQQLGQYSSDPFRDWIAKTLKSRGIETFTDVKRFDPQRELKIVVSNITHCEMWVLPDDLNPNSARLNKDQKSHRQAILQQHNLKHYQDFSIAEAVRLSSSIPLFFKPEQLGNAYILDGGLLSNFPLWIYDRPSGDPLNPPKWPTFGFRLIDQTLNPPKINNALDLFTASLRSMANARDRYHVRHGDQGRVINIDVTKAKVTTTDFSLSSEKKVKLYRLGYKQTKDFFLHHWNWKRHLKERGFC